MRLTRADLPYLELAGDQEEPHLPEAVLRDGSVVVNTRQATVGLSLVWLRQYARTRCFRPRQMRQLLLLAAGGPPFGPWIGSIPHHIAGANAPL